MSVPSIKIQIRSRTFFLSLRSEKKLLDNSFLAEAQLAKREFCEKCFGQMKKSGTRYEHSESGSIAGWDITTYKCKKCGHTHEESYSRD